VLDVKQLVQNSFGRGSIYIGKGWCTAVHSVQSAVYSFAWPKHSNVQPEHKEPQMPITMYMNVRLENLVLCEAGEPGYPYT